MVENCTATGPHFPDHGKPSVEAVAHSDEMSAKTHQDDVHRSRQRNDLAFSGRLATYAREQSSLQASLYVYRFYRLLLRLSYHCSRLVQRARLVPDTRKYLPTSSRIYPCNWFLAGHRIRTHCCRRTSWPHKITHEPKLFTICLWSPCRPHYH